MLSAAVQFYDVVLFVHITGVVLAFGPTFAYAVFLAAAERRGGRAIPAVGDGIGIWDKLASTVGILVILGTGLYLVADRWSFADFFVSWGFLAIIVLTGLAHGYFRPRTRRLVELAERDIEATPGIGPVEFSSEYRELSDQIGKVGGLAGLIVIVTLYIMTAQPFL
jgi:hypothetical protein